MARDCGTSKEEVGRSFPSAAMASSVNRVIPPSPSPHPPPSAEIRSRSTVRMRLEMILGIISSRRLAADDDRKAAEIGLKDRIEIDLNLRLGPPSEIAAEKEEEEERGSSAFCSGVVKSDGCDSFPESGEVTTAEKSSSQGECFPKTENAEEEEEDRRRDSEEGNGRVERAQNGEESDSNRIILAAEEEEEEEDSEENKKKKKKKEGHLDLLLEAVRQISGDFEDDEPEAKGKEPELEPPVQCSRSKTKGCSRWMTDFYGGFDDTAPVVRSKRGRNQVLPSRYRDSVLEPWKRVTRHKW